MNDFLVSSIGSRKGIRYIRVVDSPAR